MKHYITYVIGDWGGDGHGYKETYVLASSVDKERFLELKNIGAQMKGIDLSSLWDGRSLNALSSELQEVLDELNVPYLPDDGVWGAQPVVHSMMYLIIALVLCADADVEVKVLNDYENSCKFMEGYGLFER